MLFHELVERAWQDAAFKAQLLTEPRSCLQRIGIALPADVDVVVHENSSEVMHLVIPDRAQVGDDATAEFGGAVGPVLQRAWGDPDFAQRLLTEPAAAISEATGKHAPTKIRLMVHCDSANRRNIVIPIDPGTAELRELNRYMIGGSMLPPRPGR